MQNSCKIHFYMVFEHWCKQPAYKNPPTHFFYINNPHESEAVSKNTLFQISPYSDDTVGPSHTHIPTWVSAHMCLFWICMQQF